MYEIVLTRIFSVTMWYHFAFGAISLALFGMTFGALVVHLNPNRFPDESVTQRLWLFSLLFALSIVVCFTAQLLIPVDPSVTFSGILSVVGTCLVVAVPFVFSGVVVCLALTRYPARVNRLYAADLVGAALGCVLFVFLIGRIDAPSVVIATAALAALAAVFFAFDLARSGPKAVAVLCTVAIGGMAIGNAVLHERGKDPLHIRYVKGQTEHRHRYEKWNAFSRVTVDGDPHDPKTAQLSMVIDSTAGTSIYRYDGDTRKVASLRTEVTNLAHYARKNADVLVIGVGGGRDVLSALVFDQRSVKGVEINSNILHITNGVYGDFSGHLDRDPRVSFVNDEARAYLARTTGKYDIIQISLIDTWAATSSRVRAERELALHERSVEDLPRPSEPGRHPVGLTLVLAPQRRLATRDLPNDEPRSLRVARPRDSRPAGPCRDLRGSAPRLRRNPGHAAGEPAKAATNDIHPAGRGRAATALHACPHPHVRPRSHLCRSHGRPRSREGTPRGRRRHLATD